MIQLKGKKKRKKKSDFKIAFYGARHVKQFSASLFCGEPEYFGKLGQPVVGSVNPALFLRFYIAIKTRVF